MTTDEDADDDVRPSFASLRSRFEGNVAAQDVASSSSQISKATAPRLGRAQTVASGRHAGEHARDPPRWSASFQPHANGQQPPPPPQSAPAEQTNTPIFALPGSSAESGFPPGAILPIPPVPRRPLTPSTSLPSIAASFPGALEALAYADSDQPDTAPVSAPAPVASTSARPPPITTTQRRDASPPPPPVPERPKLASQSSAAPTAKSTSPLPYDKPLPKPVSDVDAQPLHSPPHNAGDALRSTFSAVRTLARHSSNKVRGRLDESRSSHSTPTDSGTPPNGHSPNLTSSATFSPPAYTHDLLPPPQRGISYVKGSASLTVGSVPASKGSSAAATTEDDVGDSSEEDELEAVAGGSAAAAARAKAAEEIPDASRANRRPPHYTPERTISAGKGHTTCVAVHGDLVVAGHHDKLRLYRATNGWNETTLQVSTGVEKREIKLSALAFRPAVHEAGAKTRRADGRYLWCGTKEGDLLEFDLNEARATSHRNNVHSATVMLLERVGSNMISVDESGKICTWVPKNVNGVGQPMQVSLAESPITQRIVMDKFFSALMIGEELWVASAGESGGQRLPKVRIYRPFCIDKPFNAVSRPVTIPDALGAGYLGLITCGTILPLQPDVVYLGHQSGHVSIWTRSTYSCIRVQPLHMSGVTTLCGVRGHFLWAASRQGEIRIFDVREQPWRVVKSWEAHKGAAVTHLLADPSQLDDGKLAVLSASLEGSMYLWDGLLASDWLTQELERRVAEYSSFRTLTSLQITFNIDAATTTDFDERELPGLNFVTAAEVPDIIVIGFQEMVNLQDKRLMAKNLLKGGGRRAKGGADVGERLSHQARAWTQKITTEIKRRLANADAGKGAGYRLVLQDSLVGLYSALFVRESEMINVRDSAIASIKTGFGGRMGNKGAIVASMRIDDSPLAWINLHLAAGQRGVRQRNADLVNIFECAPFTERATTCSKEVDAFAGGGDGAMILPDHEVVFLSGDLNYRIDMRREQCFDLIQKQHWHALLARDQLLRQMNENAAHRLRPFSEAPIAFAPTYKFDRRSDKYDTSEKQRVPAYCDRILWYARSERAHAVQCTTYTSDSHNVASDHRAVVGRFAFQIRKNDLKKRRAVLDELRDAWKVTQAERLRAAREFYFGAEGDEEDDDDDE